MVLGLKTKRPSVELTIHIQEVKPWPPSESVSTLRGALIQWECGERGCGFTNQVVPSQGRIEFNESFRLRHGDSYQRNCIEFSLYEARRDRGGQLLGTAVLDLGVTVIEENARSISTPIKCKRNYRNSPQPLLFLRIQPVRDRRNQGQSVSEMKKETRKLEKLDLERRINVLEGELREVAALELSLYSVAAQHGSCMNKVHAPARRLARLYFHANKQNPVVSGLVLVAKACGNDVPRLTFWLSNTIILRAIISKSFRREKPLAFVAALDKVEAWIFSRIIESLWWQSGAAKAIRTSIHSDTSKSYRNFSLELWKRAFKDACERICPVRGGGHDCGCLPLLSRLIMEPLVARLDVAMFNAILRESADEIPTDPVADPISDASVLPIPAGKASFGAGAQLKNAIGNWSRWLTELFGMDEYDDENSSETGDDRSLKAFYLLNALSDLMMLPKDLLLSPSIRKEVCPAFGLPLLRRILHSFAPDEFRSDPIPAPVLIEALNSEDLHQDSIVSLPCEAAAVAYQSPSLESVASIMGGSQLASLLKKSQMSDDELDQLDSPIILKSSRSKHDRSPCTSVRYQLLRQIWKE